MSRRLILAIVILAAPALAGRARAQTPDTLADTLFQRAERLVSEGQGETGRALVDSMLRLAGEGTAAYADALYWRATLAATAADAERDYRRLIVEYPASARAADALMRLAQLEAARGDVPSAMRHLERLAREFPEHPLRPRASFTAARLMFDEQRVQRGCARLADASRTAPADDVELRNQIEYYGQRCVGVDTLAVAAREPTPRPVPAAASPPVAAPVTTPVTTPPVTPPPRTTVRPDSGARTAAPATRAMPPAPAAPASPRFSVQVAAFRTRADAERERARLAARGYDTRVTGGGAVWRVRVGSYATREDAVAALGRIKARGLSGFVTPDERGAAPKPAAKPPVRRGTP